VIPLTAELLSKRTVVLYARCRAADPTADEIVFDIIGCDGCGVTVDLLREPWPDGWTTGGDFDTGFRDLCAECSA
jgi:hypothetical protein